MTPAPRSSPPRSAGTGASRTRRNWIREVVFGEDLSQTHTGNTRTVMAGLRNFAVSRHRLDGATDIAMACRATAPHPNRAIRLLT